MGKNMTKIKDQTVQSLADREGKYLTFSMAGEEYGFGILKIKEIIGLMTVTPILLLRLKAYT